MNASLVDVIIPVHDASRPIRRAVDSVLHGTQPGTVRILVICHGIETSDIGEQFDVMNPSVTLVRFDDGIRSPAGPFNHGLSLARAPYVSIMGSDDFLEAGAMASWTERVALTRPDAALVPLRYQGGEKLHNPLTRFKRTRKLHVVKDRLFYRTAPLGLLRREYIVEEHLAFTPELPVGKDMAFSARMWTAADRIEYLRETPCYVIGDDVESRITKQQRPVSEAMLAVTDLINRPWARNLPLSVRRALGTKLLRIHVLGAVFTRHRVEDWTPDCPAELRRSAREVLEFAQGAHRPLSRANRDILDTILGDMVSAESLVESVRRYPERGRIARIAPRNLFRIFDREGDMVRFILYRFDR